MHNTLQCSQERDDLGLKREEWLSGTVKVTMLHKSFKITRYHPN